MEQIAQEKHLRELLKKFDVAMLVSKDANEVPYARPMAVVNIDEECRVSFFANANSEKVKEIEEDSMVLVTCQDPKGAFVSLVGRAAINKEREEIDRFWTEPLKVWFPRGKHDPDLILIRVSPERGEYWDNLGANKLVYVVKAANAYLSGKKPSVSDEQHGVIEFPL